VAHAPVILLRSFKNGDTCPQSNAGLVLRNSNTRRAPARRDRRQRRPRPRPIAGHTPGRCVALRGSLRTCPKLCDWRTCWPGLAWRSFKLDGAEYTHATRKVASCILFGMDGWQANSPNSTPPRCSWSTRSARWVPKPVTCEALSGGLVKVVWPSYWPRKGRVIQKRSTDNCCPGPAGPRAAGVPSGVAAGRGTHAGTLRQGLGQ
jgi:hypothetical protein